MTGGLLARLHPELVAPRREPEPQARPGPRDRVDDQRPEWIRRMAERGLPAKVLTR